MILGLGVRLFTDILCFSYRPSRGLRIKAEKTVSCFKHVNLQGGNNSLGLCWQQPPLIIMSQHILSTIWLQASRRLVADIVMLGIHQNRQPAAEAAAVLRPETGVATALDFMLGLDGETPIVGLAPWRNKRWSLVVTVA